MGLFFTKHLLYLQSYLESSLIRRLLDWLIWRYHFGTKTILFAWMNDNLWPVICSEIWTECLGKWFSHSWTESKRTIETVREGRQVWEVDQVNSRFQHRPTTHKTQGKHVKQQTEDAGGREMSNFRNVKSLKGGTHYKIIWPFFFFWPDYPLWNKVR